VAEGAARAARGGIVRVHYGRADGSRDGARERTQQLVGPPRLGCRPRVSSRRRPCGFSVAASSMPPSIVPSGCSAWAPMRCEAWAPTAAAASISTPSSVSWPPALTFRPSFACRRARSTPAPSTLLRGVSARPRPRRMGARRWGIWSVGGDQSAIRAPDARPRASRFVDHRWAQVAKRPLRFGVCLRAQHSRALRGDDDEGQLPDHHQRRRRRRPRSGRCRARPDRLDPGVVAPRPRRRSTPRSAPSGAKASRR